VAKVEATVGGVELADTLSKLLDDPTRRAEMAMAGYEYARARSFDAVAEQLWSDVIAPLAGRVPPACE
jgi:hypothetical protein